MGRLNRRMNDWLLPCPKFTSQIQLVKPCSCVTITNDISRIYSTSCVLVTAMLLSLSRTLYTYAPYDQQPPLNRKPEQLSEVHTYGLNKPCSQARDGLGTRLGLNYSSCAALVSQLVVSVPDPNRPQPTLPRM